MGIVFEKPNRASAYQAGSCGLRFGGLSLRLEKHYWEQMMTVTLAPMEGVVDPPMRELLTRVGGYDLCITEFIRVSSSQLPPKSFIAACPELNNSSRTKSGTPIHIQLMGGDPDIVAANAFQAASLGAPGIDLNFGCPAKTVNRRDAGATLLQWPERLHRITRAVRNAVPDDIPVSAKMRLGFEDKSLALENAQAIEAAGAIKLTVHARTKLEGYRPPAHWEWLALIREVMNIQMIANGEIWSLGDYRRCLDISGCQDVMIGRGAIARPDLARLIQADNRGDYLAPLNWQEVLVLITDYHDIMMAKAGDKPRLKGIAGRLKQWIKLLGRSYPEARDLFAVIRPSHDPGEIRNKVQAQQEFLQHAA